MLSSASRAFLTRNTLNYTNSMTVIGGHMATVRKTITLTEKLADWIKLQISSGSATWCGAIKIKRASYLR